MPELPEMETYKNLLSPLIAGKRIVSTEIEREKTINLPAERWKREIPGQTVIGIERRAKHLVFRLSSGNVLLLHLMLGGKLFFGYGAERPERTAQVTLKFNDGTLYFMGLRLGYLHLLTPEELHGVLQKLGPEPLDAAFTRDRFEERIRGQRGRLKSVLPDQSFLSGIGNCYSDEICFAAELKPSRTCAALQEREKDRLYTAIRSVPQEAVHYGGYIDMPLYSGDTLTGGFDARCQVYDRGGEPCTRCGNLLTGTRLAGRKCFFCDHCQK